MVTSSVGLVVEVGPRVTAVRIGDRVSVENLVSCGVCEFCRAGLNALCVRIGSHGSIGVTRDGGLAEYCVAPEHVCFPIPPEIDDVHRNPG